ncbi:MAG: stage II sporulation protein R, partial [Lysinibacillus sp.]
KWLAVLNFLLAGFIVYTMNNIAMYYFNNEATAADDSLYAVRVVASSNREEDQAQKEQVAKTVQQYMVQGLYKEPIEVTAKQLYKTLKENYPQLTMEISVGQHLIPPKLVDNRLYPQQKRASIVIKLGNGRGENWFCSVFPQTCEPELSDEDIEHIEEDDEVDLDDVDKKQEREWLFKRLWQYFNKDEE